MQNIFNKFSAIAGNYELNVFMGVWHAYCDSGIMTDAFSVQDSKRVQHAGLYKQNAAGECYADTHTLHNINAAVVAHDGGADLHCVQCVNAITALGYDVEEFFAAYCDVA